jgi:RES domain
MLNRARAITVSERVSRVTQSPDRRRKVQRLRDDLRNGREFAEALEFLGGEAALGAVSITELAQIPFRGPPFSEGRYSAGTAYGVLYTARRYRTANKEVAYWQRQFYNPSPGVTYRIRLQLISWLVRGAAKDVRRFLNEFPWLIDDDHTQCWALGAQARANGLVCLIAPSARDRPRGTTVPVFVSGAVSQGGYDGEVTFFIPAAGPVRFRTKFT